MGTKYAFLDETGNFGYNFDASGTSHYFIVTAVIILEENFSKIKQHAEGIRQKYFQTGEMKSSSVGSNHRRRAKILNELINLDFNIYSVVINKEKIYKDSGLQYKQSYYKYLYSKLFTTLKSVYPYITVQMDELGDKEFQEGFKKYVYDRKQMLFDLFNFEFENSKESILIQVADFIGGTLSYIYDQTKKTNEIDFLSILKGKVIIDFWPEDHIEYTIKYKKPRSEIDTAIADTALRQADIFIKENVNSEDPDVIEQVRLLKYLRFMFLNFNSDGYISTKELIRSFHDEFGKKISAHYLRTKIIAKLRDHQVIIASSIKGYKLPANENELQDFANHGNTVILPMLKRIEICRKIILLSTHNQVDILEGEQYKQLKEFYDYKMEQS